MDNLDRWLKEHFSKVGDTAAPLTSGEKQDLQKLVTDALERLEVNVVRLKQLSNFCKLVDQCSVHARPTFVGQELILDGFLKSLLDFAVQIASMDRDIHRALREDTNLLSTLTNSLSGKYRCEDQTRILKYIEVLSRDLSLCWTAPFVKGLFEQMFSIILNTPSSSEGFLHALRTVNNITFHNHNCLIIAVRDAKYKDMTKRLLTIVGESHSIKEINSLAMQCLLTMNQALTFKMESMLNNIKETFLNLHLLLTADGVAMGQAMTKVIASIHHMNMCLRSVLAQMFKIWSEQTETPREDNDDDYRTFVAALQQTMTIIFKTFFSKCTSLLGTSSGQLILDHLLQLLVVFSPTTMPDAICDKLWVAYIKYVNELTTVSSTKKANSQIVVLETHLHLIDRLMKSGIKKIPAESFTSILKTCQLVVSTSDDDIRRNVLTIRLIHRLNALAYFQHRKDNAFQNLLPEETLATLLKLILEEKTGESQFPDVKLSTCVIEVLNVISKHSKSPTALLENIEKETTWIHIANCIVNGDEDLIVQVFTLMSAVGFSSKCRSGVSRTLSNMKDVVPAPRSLSASPEKQPLPSYTAQIGMAKLNHNLEKFAELYQEKSEPAFDDLLSWYTLKTEMYEMELTTMNDHVFHLNRTISHLKSLLTKQSELATKRATSTTSMQDSFNDLKKQLELTNEKKLSLETKHAKAMTLLQQQLELQEKICKSKTDKLLTVEQQLKQMKEKCTKLEASKAEALQSSQKVTAEKKKLQEKNEELEKACKSYKQKGSLLEAELKKSEESRKTVESLLESEKRKTEIIQQVLGNRLT